MERTIDEKMVVAEDTLIADVQFAIHNLLEAKRVSRATLARKLGVSEARISQLFCDEAKNLTLRTLARIFHVLGEEPQITSDTLRRIIPLENDGGSDAFDADEEPGKHALLSAQLRVLTHARAAFEFSANENFAEFDLAA
jgi:transcriptional regulator with XRE-family HTH domain